MLVCTVVMMGGCAAAHVDYTTFARTPDVVLADARYRIASPDDLRIHAPGMREIDGWRVTVPADGTIALPTLGRVHAAGLTRFELAALLTRRAAEHTVNPHVSVRVERYASQHIFVRGHVARPGAQRYTGQNTALTALAHAVPTRDGDPSRILVLEPTDEGGYRARAVIDLDALVDGQRWASDILLQPGEIVHVPRHPWADGPGRPTGQASHNHAQSPSTDRANGFEEG